jgi:hypothetical protein
MTESDALALWLVFLVIFYYFGTPLLVLFRQKLAAHPKFRALDFDNLDPPIAQFLMTRTKDLFDMGFGEPTLIQSRAASNVTLYLILLVNRPAGDKAFVTTAVGQGLVTIRAYSVVFSTRFEAGEVFDTHNIRDPLAFPPDPNHVRTQVPMLGDLQKLYECRRVLSLRHELPGARPCRHTEATDL